VHLTGTPATLQHNSQNITESENKKASFKTILVNSTKKIHTTEKGHYCSLLMGIFVPHHAPQPPLLAMSYIQNK
jgi:hypothetical protein